MRQWVAVVGLMVAVLAGVSARAEQAVAPQSPAAASAVVAGTVVDAVSGQPLSGVVLDMAVEREGVPLATRLPRQITNAKGQFTFQQVPAGRVTIRATPGGVSLSSGGFLQDFRNRPVGAYLEGGTGQGRPGGRLRAIEIKDGQHVSGEEIRMWRAAALMGVVTDDLGEPVVDAVVGAVRVSTDGTLLDGPTTNTDDLGRYRLSALEPGRYVVYVPQSQTVMPAAAVDAAMAEHQARVANGLAAPKPAWQFAGVRVGGAYISSTSTSSTDSGNVPRFINGAAFVYPTTFYPSSTSLNTNAAIELKAGEERIGINVNTRPLPTASVTGTLLAAGEPAAGVRLRVMATGSADAGMFEVANGVSDSQGRFEFPALPIGDYTLVVMGGSIEGSSPTRYGAYWLAEPLSVGVDGVANLSITLRVGVSLRGQLEFEGASQRPDAQALKNVVVVLTPMRRRFRGVDVPSLAVIDPNHQFVSAGIVPGRYYIRPLRMQFGGWYLKSIQIGGRDVTEFPIDVSGDVSGVVMTFTDQVTRLVANVDGAHAEDPPVVLLFPSDRSAWTDLRRGNARAPIEPLSGSGSVTFTNLLAGDYLAIAVPESIADEFPDKELLGRLASQATPLKITSGQRTTISLSVRRPQ